MADYEDIFELNIHDDLDRDDVSLSSYVLDASLPNTPLLSYTHIPESYYNYTSYVEEPAANHFMYECCICKNDASQCNHATEPRFLSTEDSQALKFNNDLIQENYRKWLFSTN